MIPNTHWKCICWLSIFFVLFTIFSHIWNVVIISCLCGSRFCWVWEQASHLYYYTLWLERFWYNDFIKYTFDQIAFQGIQIFNSEWLIIYNAFTWDKNIYFLGLLLRNPDLISMLETLILSSSLNARKCSRFSIQVQYLHIKHSDCPGWSQPTYVY